MTLLRRVITVLVLGAGAAGAQRVRAQAQPNRIAFGNVHTGATVEASFMVLQQGDDEKIKFEVTAPKLVKVIRNRACEEAQKELEKLGHEALPMLRRALQSRPSAEA